MAEEKSIKVCSSDLKDTQEYREMFIRIIDNYIGRYSVDEMEEEEDN